MEMTNEMRRQLREVLSYVMDSEGKSFDIAVAEHGEDSEILDNHVFSIATSLYIDFGFDEDDRSVA